MHIAPLGPFPLARLAEGRYIKKYTGHINMFVLFLCSNINAQFQFCRDAIDCLFVCIFLSGIYVRMCLFIVHIKKKKNKPTIPSLEFGVKKKFIIIFFSTASVSTVVFFLL